MKADELNGRSAGAGEPLLRFGDARVFDAPAHCEGAGCGQTREGPLMKAPSFHVVRGTDVIAECLGGNRRARATLQVSRAKPWWGRPLCLPHRAGRDACATMRAISSQVLSADAKLKG